jgi:hypothetical protein
VINLELQANQFIIMDLIILKNSNYNYANLSKNIKILKIKKTKGDHTHRAEAHHDFIKYIYKDYKK